MKFTGLLAFSILLLNLWLNAPLFSAGEAPYRGSIDGGYASMTRFIAEHPDPWGWNPRQYCGMPTALMYLPFVHYLGALVVWTAGVDAAQAHRLVTTTFACLVPVGVFLFAFYFTRSRLWALGAALSYTFFSPLYALIETIDRDRGEVYLPWRLQVLVKYGEGPHMVGLALLPAALAAVWSAAVSKGFPRLLLAAVLAAAVALTNWISAFALALSAVAMLLTALPVRKQTGFKVSRPIAAAFLAWLLAAFWMTPTLIGNIALNWPADSLEFGRGTARYALAGACAAALVVLRWILLRYLPSEHYLCFVTLAAFLFGWIVQVRYCCSADTIPESHRYALEFSMFLLLALLAWFRLALRSPNGVTRFCGIGPACAMLLTVGPDALSYLSRSHEKWMPLPKEETVEYRLARWLEGRDPRGRVMVSGGLRYRLNLWSDVPQTGGAFESGLTNRASHHMSFLVRTGADGPEAVRLLKSMGVEYVVVHGPGSKEHYRDTTNPSLFEGVLEPVYREAGDVVYKVPFDSFAHLSGSGGSLPVVWRGATALAIEGPVPEGEAVSLQVSHDPGWTATQGGRPVAITSDRSGFMLLQAHPAPSARIELRYGATPERIVMAGISAAAWIASFAGLFLTQIRSS